MIRNIWHLPFIGLRLLYNLLRQYFFIQKNILKEIEAASKSNDGSLTDLDLKKIRLYYGLGAPAIIGEAFCLLRGTGMTHRERLACTYQGAMTGLFDDFFDEKRTTENEITALIQEPETLTGKNTNEKLLLHFYREALTFCPQSNVFKTAAYTVYEAQIWSQQQHIATISRDQIRKITHEKGGVSLLFYRAAFAPATTKIEEEMLYTLGAIMQLGNDIFDVYKDYQNNIHTLMTTAANVADIRAEFTALMDKMRDLAHQTHYQKPDVRAFLRYIAMFIGRTFVCLDMLQKRQDEKGGVFSVTNYTRKELICDMEKPLNLISSVLYYVRYKVD